MRGVGALCSCHLDAGDNLRFHSAHELGLDVIGFAAFLAPLVVVPPVVCRRGKAGRIDGEIGLDGLQWLCAFLDQASEQGSERRVMQTIEDAVVGRHSTQEPLTLQLPQVYHGPSPKDGRVDLIASGHDNIGERMTAPSRPCLLRLDYALAEFAQEFRKPLLLVNVNAAVDRPVLAVGDSDCLRFDSDPITMLFLVDDELNGKDMLARTERLPIVQLDVWVPLPDWEGTCHPNLFFLTVFDSAIASPVCPQIPISLLPSFRCLLLVDTTRG